MASNVIQGRISGEQVTGSWEWLQETKRGWHQTCDGIWPFLLYLLLFWGFEDIRGVLTPCVVHGVTLNYTNSLCSTLIHITGGNIYNMLTYAKRWVSPKLDSIGFIPLTIAIHELTDNIVIVANFNLCVTCMSACELGTCMSWWAPVAMVTCAHMGIGRN